MFMYSFCAAQHQLTHGPRVHAHGLTQSGKNRVSGDIMGSRAKRRRMGKYKVDKEETSGSVEFWEERWEEMQRKAVSQSASLRGRWGKGASKSMIVPMKEHDSDCNRFFSPLPRADLPVGECLFTDGRWECKGRGHTHTHTIIYCRPISPWFAVL